MPQCMRRLPLLAGDHAHAAQAARTAPQHKRSNRQHVHAHAVHVQTQDAALLAAPNLLLGSPLHVIDRAKAPLLVVLVC